MRQRSRRKRTRITNVKLLVVSTGCCCCYFVVCECVWISTMLCGTHNFPPYLRLISWCCCCCCCLLSVQFSSVHISSDLIWLSSVRFSTAPWDLHLLQRKLLQRLKQGLCLCLIRQIDLCTRLCFIVACCTFSFGFYYRKWLDRVRLPDCQSASIRDVPPSSALFKGSQWEFLIASKDVCTRTQCVYCL